MTLHVVVVRMSKDLYRPRLNGRSNGGDDDERWWRRRRGLVVTATSCGEDAARFGVDKERDQRYENCEIGNQRKY